jgi:uncharacterized OsmC-like protein
VHDRGAASRDPEREQTRRLKQVAKDCAVHRTLEHGIAFDHAVAVAVADPL